MKKICLILLMFPIFLFAQSKVGWEMRTNGKSFIHFAYKRLELREKNDLKEIRITYRHPIVLSDNLILSFPLHYKIEKKEYTFEPRLIYKFPKFKLWIQEEFNHIQLFTTAFAVDIPIKDFEYRIGWDSSKTIRFRVMKTFL